MADEAIVHIGENSPEQIAYKLLHDIARVEGKPFQSSERNPKSVANRAWILKTFAQCLLAVRNPGGVT